MPSPFPGMDPYLENPEFWPAVHNRLIVAIIDYNQPLQLSLGPEDTAWLQSLRQSLQLGAHNPTD